MMFEYAAQTTTRARRVRMKEEEIPVQPIQKTSDGSVREAIRGNHGAQQRKSSAQQKAIFVSN